MDDEMRQLWHEFRWMAQKGELDAMARMHAEHPLLITMDDGCGWTLLHAASMHCQLKAVQWLHKQEPSFIARRNDYGSTPLHAASMYGNLDVVKWLVETDPSLLDVRNEYNETALDWARENNYHAVAEFLDNFTRYPLHFAAGIGGGSDWKQQIEKMQDILNKYCKKDTVDRK